MQNQIQNNWQVRPLSFFADRVTYGFTNPMPTSETGPFMVTAKDIVDGRINYGSCRKTTSSAYEKLLTDKSRPGLGDILLTKDGTLGRVALVTQVPLCINQSVALIKVNGNKIVPIFLKYLLESPVYQKIMLSEAGGSTIGHIYITRVDKMEIAVPSQLEQKKIVNHIESLDYKLELNNKIIKTLEDMGQAIFKEWFVRTSAIGQEYSLLDIAEYINGGAFGKIINNNKKGAPLIKIATLNGGITSITEWIDTSVADKYYLADGDLLFSWSGSVDLFIWDKGRAVLNQHIFNVKPKGYFSKGFVYFVLRSKLRYFQQIAGGKATTMGHIKKEHLEERAVVVPKNANLEIFDVVYRKLIKLKLENQKLYAIRDLLLPKLMRGEIRV